MKKFIVFLTLISHSFFVQAQIVSFKDQVMLFPVSKPVIINVNGISKELKLSWTCTENAEIKIVRGKVSVLTNKGNELTFDTGSVIKVTKANLKKQSFPLRKTSKYINEPSVYFPNLYSHKRGNLLIFPVKSKVAKAENLRFYFNDIGKIKDAVFKLYAKNTKKLIWESKKFANEFEYGKFKLELNSEYYWRMHNESNSVKGEFVLLGKNEIKSLQIPKKMKRKKDFLILFFTYLDHECLFDAAATLIKATEKYPDSELFKILRTRLPSLSTP